MKATLKTQAFLTVLISVLLLTLQAGTVLAADAPGYAPTDTYTASIDTEKIFQHLEMYKLNSTSGFPTNNIHAIHQDKHGFIWIGTEFGLYRYDGFLIKRYKNDQKRPELFSSNRINCIANDGDSLWLGTNKGINLLNLKNGDCRQYHFDDFINCDNISSILITKGSNGQTKQMWVGTEGGLYLYEPSSDHFLLMCNQRNNSKVPHCAVKSLYEDHKGYIWIGTWDKGLYRYDPTNSEFYEVPKFNDLNSAQVVLEDQSHRLWVGTWGKGLYLIRNPYETNKPLDFQNFMTGNTDRLLPSDVIYSLTEDPYTGLLWIGTSKGLCIYANNRFHNIPSDKMPSPTYFNRGASTQLCDRNGNVWINASLTGLVTASIRPKDFEYHLLPEALQDNDVINSMTYDQAGNIWIGLERNGLVYYRKETGEYICMKDMPVMKDTDIPQKTNCIYETRNGDILIGTTRDGFMEINRDRTLLKHMNMQNTPWLPDNCIYSFLEDDMGNLLIGTWQGLCVRYADNKEQPSPLQSLKETGTAQIRHIMQSRDGHIWLSTKDKGIMCLKGDIRSPQSLEVYSYRTPLNTQFPINDINKTLQDSEGRVWACSLENGLMLYDEEQDGFICVNKQYGIPDDDICSIEEGRKGNLWISSQQGIMCLQLNAEGQFINLRYIPNTNETDDAYFGKGISCSNGTGTVCFGGVDSYTTFADKQLSPKTPATEINITDIKIFNTPLEMLPAKERKAISKLLPPYTNKIQLSHAQNDITIEFSSLTYDTRQESRFAYKLEGHDKEWIYPAARQHSAYYSNLPAGEYIFLLKATDINGIWRDKAHPLHITVLPPVWKRWWAILFYFLLLAGAGYSLFKYQKQRTLQQRELQLAHLANKKIDELNHKKLQFFTNITHDLMTPLTVIQATVSELEMECPNKAELCRIIQSNLSRQIRLLQQILEFRKAETGNLQLRVSEGDIADFCRKEIESIDPLMKRKKLHLSLLCSPEHIRGYFDPDALDKIVYNLLSNAAKYTQAMGYVQVTLTYENNEDFINLTVKDNGQGIAAHKQADLFKRFYEGEYRKFNTYGTGIGLSLTKDLVTLHHGTITVKSEEGQGTTFTVTLPIRKRFFHEEEIDDPPLYVTEEKTDPASLIGTGEQTQTVQTKKQQDEPETEHIGSVPPVPSHTLLIVEDNEELITLMKRLLQPHYNIITAYNGKEAIEIMENEKIDLIVADVMMPVMNGIEMAKQLRDNPDFSNCPIIMLTAKRSEQDRAEAYEAGADAYITKPFHLSVLQTRIQNLLKRREKAIKEVKEKLFEGLGELDITNADEEFLKKCINCVHKHLNDADFDQQRFADETNTSKSTLYKKLKTLTGLNTSAFIRNIRMKAACEIALKNPNIRISDLAYSVGYNDPKYFSSCFKKDFGMLPSEYIKSKSQDPGNNRSSDTFHNSTGQDNL